MDRVLSGTLMQMIICWLLNRRVGFRGQGVLARKTATLHVNVLHGGREAVQRVTRLSPPLLPFLPLIRSLWRAFSPEVQAGQGLGLDLPVLTALCSLQDRLLLQKELITE